MNCPDKETLQDLIDSELPQDEAQSMIEHIQLCKDCKDQLREIFVLHSTLNSIVQKEACPPVDTLEQYAENACPAEKIDAIKEHVDLCAHCRSYVWAFQSSEEELAEWQAQEERSYHEYLTQSPGYHTAKETLLALLPDKIELLDKGWQSVDLGDYKLIVTPNLLTLRRLLAMPARQEVVQPYRLLYQSVGVEFVVGSEKYRFSSNQRSVDE